MSRARALSLAAAAVAALAACGDDAAPAAAFVFRQPAALAAFSGITLDDAATLRPYLAVANASRNDLTLVDASDDTPVGAAIELRALVIPVADRPSLLASAPLGDGGADLLVAVSAGSSVLQLVRTWSAANDVVDGASVDLGADVVALAALPSSPQTAGTARVAVALAGPVGGAPGSGPEIAVVEYARAGSDGAIQPGAVTRSGPLGFQPLALATLPDDPGAAGLQTEIYAATLDEIAPGVQGVAALPADLATVTALDARGPTRLVGAARLRERAGASTASDASAFAPGPVPRVYAVLDESGCGPERRIDCGLVSLDPDPAVAGLPADWSGRMPYRAPLRVPGRPLALAVAQPTAVAPPENPAYAGDLMRLFAGASERATTAVGAVASSDGSVYFLDLGRFETATSASPVASRTPGAQVPLPLGEGAAAARLWFLAGAEATTFPLNADEAGAGIRVTPGYTPTDAFTVSYQGVLLGPRGAQAGVSGTRRWLALQGGLASRPPSGAVRVFHPALGVKSDAEAGSGGGDIVVIEGAGAACEARVESLLAPEAAFPGGAIVPAQEGEGTCVADLYAGLGDGGVRRDLTATVRARALVLTTSALGYAGRPVRGVEYALEYPADASEDALAQACPLADWDGSFPAVGVDLTCGGTCDRSATGPCERLVLARKARRIHHLSYPCEDDACRARFPGVVFPEANGPAVAFTVDVQRCPGGACDPARPAEATPARGMAVTLTPVSGVSPLSAPRASPGSPFHASGAIAFDRSPVNAAAGYRFLVAYPADLVYDVTPSVNPVGTALIR